MNNDKNKCPDHPEKDNLYCSECIKRISAEAQANTAKEIFKELAKICRQQIEPAQLERFAKEFFDAKDESEAFAIAQKFSKIVFYADEYKAVKNKWVE
jgi:hypothetical protein